jgi:hypothetical protein
VLTSVYYRSLALGLMEQCTKDYVIDNGICNHIPGLWQEKIRTHRLGTKPISPLPVAETHSGLDLSVYNRLSGKLCVCGAILCV